MCYSFELQITQAYKSSQAPNYKSELAIIIVFSDYNFLYGVTQFLHRWHRRHCGRKIITIINGQF